jgi:hypothetical protein
MTKTFTVATGNTDSEGDIIKLDGVSIPDRVLLTFEFDNTNPIGYCKVRNTGSELIASADIPDNFVGMYPAIGFQIVKSHYEGRIRVIDEMKLHYIGLSTKPNVDEFIKPIQ